MAAAVAMMMATAFAVLVVVVAAALAVTVVMVTAAATALFLRQVFAVETFLKLFLRGVANRKNLTLEIKGFACHGVVEIHGNGVFLNCYNFTVNYMAGAVEHRDEVAYFKQVFAYFAVNLEAVLGNVEAVLGLVCAVAFFGAYKKVEGASGLLALNL